MAATFAKTYPLLHVDHAESSEACVPAHVLQPTRVDLQSVALSCNDQQIVLSIKRMSRTLLRIWFFFAETFPSIVAQQYQKKFGP